MEHICCHHRIAYQEFSLTEFYAQYTSARGQSANRCYIIYNKKYTLVTCHEKLTTGFTENMCAKLLCNFKRERETAFTNFP